MTLRSMCVVASCCVLPALASSCGRERSREYEAERTALAGKVVEIQSAQIALLQPDHHGSVQELHELHEVYAHMQEEGIAEMQKDVAEMGRILAVRDEVLRVRALPWRKR